MCGFFPPLRRQNPYPYVVGTNSIRRYSNFKAPCWSGSFDFAILGIGAYRSRFAATTSAMHQNALRLERKDPAIGYFPQGNIRWSNVGL